jgi:hypothetical protein
MFLYPLTFHFIIGKDVSYSAGALIGGNIPDSTTLE